MKSWCWDSHERKKMQDRESYIRNLWRPRQLELTSSRQLFPKKMWSLTRLLVILCEKAICHFLNQLHVASFPAAIWTFWVLNFLSDLSFNVFAWGPQTLPPPRPLPLSPPGSLRRPKDVKKKRVKTTVFSCLLKVSNDLAHLMRIGRLIHRNKAATDRKHLNCSIPVWVDNMKFFNEDLRWSVPRFAIKENLNHLWAEAWKVS